MGQLWAKSMERRKYIDAFGSRVPALEAAVIHLRALQMILALFYAEDLKRTVRHMIQASDRFGSKLPRVPPGAKNPVDKALGALVSDGAITKAEKTEIVELIDFRNNIGHQIQNLLADVAAGRHVRDIIDLPKHPKYRPDAVERLKHFRQRLENLHQYVGLFDFDGIVFASAEKVLSREIIRLRKRIEKLARKRTAVIKAVNLELSVRGTPVGADLDRYTVHLRYGLDGPLTTIGAEICYRLFEAGKSPMAVSHILRISLAAASQRQRAWTKLGGMRRPRVDLNALKKPRIRPLYDD